jgi:hypothetical protein
MAVVNGKVESKRNGLREGAGDRRVTTAADATSIKEGGGGHKARRPVTGAVFVLFMAMIIATLAPSVASAAYQQVGAFGKSGEETLLSAELGSIAVNAETGDVYVADKGNRRIEVFKADGEFIEAWGWGVASGAEEMQTCTAGCLTGLSGEGNGQFEAPAAVAVDQATGDVFVLDGERATGVVQVFSPAGAFQTSFGTRGQATADEIQQPGGLAVGPDGKAYISDEGEAFGPRVMVFSAAHSYETAIGLGIVEFPHAVAVDAEGDVFVSDEDAVWKFLASGALSYRHSEASFSLQSMTVDQSSGTVTYFVACGTFKPEVGCIAEYVQLDTKGQISERFVAAAGQEATVGLAFNPGLSLSGRPAGVLYAADEGLREGFILAEPVPVVASVEAEFALEIGETSATLSAEINPNGSRTHYTFQYGTAGPCSSSACQEAPLGGAQLGNGSVVLPVRASISGLLSGTTYHYRVLVTNAAGTTPGPDREFRTFEASLAELPDNRADELVSPSDKGGGEVLPIDPNVYSPCAIILACKAGSKYTRFPMQATADGESVVYEGTPFGSDTGGPVEDEYVASRSPEDWRSETLTPPSIGKGEGQGTVAVNAALSKSIVYQIGESLTPNAPHGYSNLYVEENTAPTNLVPLVASKPPHRKEGRFFGSFTLSYAGGSSDFSHQLFSANDALTPAVPGTAPAAPEVGTFESDLYEWVEGDLRLVNVLPGNTEASPGATFGGPQTTYRAISEDGSRIFWTGTSGQTYVRENGTVTRAIPDLGGSYVIASTDGTKVVLSDGHLVDVAADPMTEVDLTQGKGGFLGVAGESESLSSIYFVDEAVLDEAPSSQGAVAAAGEPNLYVYRSGAVKFIATVLASDDTSAGTVGGGGGHGLWDPSPSRRRGEASPDGDWFAFLSGAPLTGYDNDCKACAQNSVGSPVGGPQNEAFLYDLATGVLSCASCNPTGEEPLGGSNLPVIGQPAAQDPQQPKYLNDEGRLVFDSRDSLVSRDTNAGIEDVYEWEPDGVGTCAKTAGCVGLLSGGRDPDDSNFLAMDTSGKNIFFTTRQQISPLDHDDFYDLYDAREGGGFPAQASAGVKECEGEACQAAGPAPPPQVAAASAAFSGSGNLAPQLPVAGAKPKPKQLTRAQKLTRALKACNKKPKKQRRACQTAARKRFGTKTTAKPRTKSKKERKS